MPLSAAKLAGYGERGSKCLLRAQEEVINEINQLEVGMK